MAKRMILMLVVMLCLLGGIFGRWMYKGIVAGKANAAQRPPPVTVSSAVAREESWQPALHAVGSFVAVQGVTITSELDGTVTRIVFESGAEVRQGELLVQQDISSEEALLAGAQARADLAQLNLQRAIDLRQQNTNSAVDLDTAQALGRQTAAEMAAIQATIAKKTFTAPFSGRLGIRQVNLGQFIKGGTAIVALESLDPIYLNFTLPQQVLKNLQTGQPVHATVDAYPGEVFSGTINALDSRLNDATRSVMVQATLANADQRLRPGMFAGVDVLLPVHENVVTVPQTAVVYNPYGNAVYVVEETGGNAAGGPSLKVRQQFVKVGETRGDQIAIAQGIKPGEQVVTAGQLKLRNDVEVRVDNTVPVADNPAPRPPNT